MKNLYWLLSHWLNKSTPEQKT
uniref:Uncharacterized protein n=1 Tax=Anguilla anguilla TaxID=7936 RepID=A0A0E9PKM8_ANGAN